MKKFLLTASAIAAIAAPALSFAQDHPGNGPGDRDAHHEVHQDARRDVHQDAKHDVRQDVKQDVRQDVRHDVRQDVRQGRVFDRNDRSWWRGRPEFNGYNGARAGYWFIPGRGYIRPAAQWYGYNWRVGGFVPRELRSYWVPNPYVLGLEPVGPAFRYIYLGQNIALMNVRNGRIVRVVPNVYF